MYPPGHIRAPWLLAGAACILFSVLLPSCSQKEEPLAVDLSKKAETTRAQDAHTITYAYLPQYSHSVSYQRHNPLIEYLKKETGLSIRQIFPDTFDEHM